jgi:NAD(P)-dependent dehydrogenase (short-subunit alcohol dehydrogenase family)
VIATARKRSLSQLNDLKAKGADTLELDVTAPLEDLKIIAQQAVAIHGRIDVVVNNAGYILVGAIEENTYVFFVPFDPELHTEYLLRRPEETYNQFKYALSQSCHPHKTDLFTAPTSLVLSM